MNKTRKIVAGNWKMNLGLVAAGKLASDIVKGYHDRGLAGKKVILGVPFPFLSEVRTRIAGERRIYLAAQNMHHEASGAYTGEVSAAMLSSVGCDYVIIGHSERRQYFGEDNVLLFQKNKLALSQGLKPIYCVGETLEQREAGETLEVIKAQMAEGILEMEPQAFADCVIAYEPVWAIGTGRTATPEQAQEVHAFIRGLVKSKYGANIAEDCSILYGGSVNAANATTLFSQPDIDGGLVGGASLKPAEFLEIIAAN